MIRTIVQIDEDKCNGCGVCIPHCHEGAIKIIDGKARLVADKYCDGFGDCLGKCPLDAITLIKREADDFDEEAVMERMKPQQREASSCPGLKIMELDERESDETTAQSKDSSLGNWPVQLSLLSPSAPYFADSDLLIAADCVAFAHPAFHNQLLKGKSVGIGCPKLDDASSYVEKISEIVRQNQINSITVAHMEVPCCSGLSNLVEKALQLAGKSIPVRVDVVGIDGREI